MKYFTFGLFPFIFLSLLPCFVYGQNLFEFSTKEKANYIDNARAYIIPVAQQFINYNYTELGNILRKAPPESEYFLNKPGLKLSLPTPDGSYKVFDIYESIIMEQKLYEMFPSIRNYIAVNQNNKLEHGRIDITDQGFHAMIFTEKGLFFIDPASLNNHETLISYYKKDLKNTKGFECGVLGSEITIPGQLEERDIFNCNSSNNLYSFKIAVAATGEYSAFQGGTVSLSLSAVNTTINRVNSVYEKELSLRLSIVANNNLIIYTNAATDPYTNNNDLALLMQNQSNLDAVIGSANYNIGHVFSTAGGGLASSGVVCVNGQKAKGETGTSAPVGDPYDIDYVAHEIGHQFSANHTFNSIVGSCGGGNRNGATAYEPGSGSTIMAYAGICGADNVQSNSDPYFANISLIEILTFINNAAACKLLLNTANTSPEITSFTTAKTIPANTPFYLDAAATDVNSDPITYCWEENDLGAGGTIDPTSASKPIFRSVIPTSSGRRYFPNEASVLSNSTPGWEKLSLVPRTLKFMITARDNHAPGGAACYKLSTITVANSPGFLVTSPNTAVTWLGPSVHDITWNVAGTASAPINCSTVNIELSVNNGVSYSSIANAVPNSGTWTWNLPGGFTTNNARIRISGNNNIFYDINNVPFTIQSTIPLPLEFMSVTAKKAGTEVQINWLTANEKDVQSYEVEWLSGNKFIPIATVSAMNQSSNTSYQAMHKNPVSEVNYYRIKSRDRNGNITYSGIASVDMGKGSNVNLFPNPAQNSITLIPDEYTAINAYKVFDAGGKVVLSERIENNVDPKVEINISELPSGLYFVQINEGALPRILKFLKS